MPPQCAHAAGPPEPDTPLVRRPSAWPARHGGDGPAETPRDGPALAPRPPDAAPPDIATLVVEAARHAARALGHVPGAPPWLPQLPRRADVADLPPIARRDRAALVLALGDDPERQRRTAVAWDPGDGHVAIVGRARSGRTTALVTIAQAALRRGWTVHGITRDPQGLEALGHHHGYGRTVRPDDSEALAHLFTDAAGPDSGPARTLILVDGAEDVRGMLPPAALRSEIAFALTADGPSMGGLTSRVGPRLVLLGTDRAADVVLGAPVGLAGTGGPPGRAVWCGRSDPVLCQVLEPGLSPRSRSPTSPPRRRAS